VASGIASAVEEQGAATQEIARNVEQAAAGTQEVSSNITGVSQAANDTGAAATQIRSAAGELSVQSENLSAAVDKFLTVVRAAWRRNCVAPWRHRTGGRLLGRPLFLDSHPSCHG
jgi:hypothetical protein